MLTVIMFAGIGVFLGLFIIMGAMICTKEEREKAQLYRDLYHMLGGVPIHDKLLEELIYSLNNDTYEIYMRRLDRYKVMSVGYETTNRGIRDE
jgi:hypothetical protein